ncbi:hypothetical protein BDP27DRAFT_923863 [Rhodocollybia butyracea]|uniref:Meiotically up-regulated protein Msb1/Mug8 domain-containing protein n=1 Tax=Rhodocollybia butyracea TaxID=206335 RepID=A0A9P5PK96_9AGAR|nr:hypothetical protein BDP27DRAFT_923863 [Rhodocollybia butyracea]
MGFFSRSHSVPADDSSGAVDQASVDVSPRKSKKEKKKAAKEQISKVASDETSLDSGDQPPSSEKERFLPLTLERPTWISPDTDTDFGFLSFERHVVLGVEQVSRLVDILCEELSTRGGLDTPFIFSNLAAARAIDVAATKRLVKSFLGTCLILVGKERDLAERKWRDEARFANMHELGMCLRWGLARITRVIDGVEHRGLLNWEHYLQWAEQEQALNYPSGHFRNFLPTLDTSLRLVILTILSLLARLTAHSATSGHTPPTLSPLFGPLIFGLGPSGQPFNHTYAYYLRSVNAMEHMQLAFIRWQDTTGNSNILSGGSASTMGVPPRLKEWVKRYPAMLDNNRFSSIIDKNYRPRKGARTVRVTSVRRNVKTYERDLVKTAASWGQSPPSSGGGSGTVTPSSAIGGLASSSEWLRISPLSYGYDTSRLPPKYSDSYRKRLNLSANASPEISHPYTVTPPIDFNSPPPSARTAFSFNSLNTDFKGDLFSSPTRGSERDYKSLSDERWGNFEHLGFGGKDETTEKLQFDLNESAKVRSVKRETLDWNSFSTSGFSRSDTPLKTALQLSVPPQLSLNTSPTRSPGSSPPITPVENKKLRKKTKNGGAPAFNYDLEPVLGPEQIIEEAFLDVYCDLLRGSGWCEGLHTLTYDNKSCNWALVEFKALPFEEAGHPLSDEFPPDSDPRTSTSLLLFEEYVLGEYHEQTLSTLHE